MSIRTEFIQCRRWTGGMRKEREKRLEWFNRDVSLFPPPSLLSFLLFSYFHNRPTRTLPAHHDEGGTSLTPGPNFANILRTKAPKVLNGSVWTSTSAWVGPLRHVARGGESFLVPLLRPFFLPSPCFHSHSSSSVWEERQIPFSYRCLCTMAATVTATTTARRAPSDSAQQRWWHFKKKKNPPSLPVCVEAATTMIKSVCVHPVWEEEEEETERASHVILFSKGRFQISHVWLR